MPLRTIAAGLDGSETATDAFAWAVGLARSQETSLHAIHVWQTPFICTYPWSCPSTEEEIRHARSLVHDTLTAVGVDRHVESTIVRGAAGPLLTTESASADLLVIGRTGQTLVDYKPRFGEIVAGATARYCVNHARVPVAAVPSGSSWTDAPSVLVGIDGSPTSLTALRWATDYLPADASIHALYAVNAPTADFEAELLDPIVDRHRVELRRLVDGTLSESFLAAGRSIQVHVVLGYAADALAEPDFPCDLVVIGEHGETATAPGVLGSVADHTLRYTPVPLIVVPATQPATLDQKDKSLAAN